MWRVIGSLALGSLATSSLASAKAVESIQIVVGNELRLMEGSDVVYFENVLQVQKGWATFERDQHTVFAGTELLLEPVTLGDRARVGVDTIAGVVGYRFATYEPDWYTFAVKLRVPFGVVGDPFRRPVCGTAEDPGCLEPRSYGDRLQLVVDPIFFKKTWNLFAIQDRNRLTFDLQSAEYGNKIRFVDISPDLDFPIALYAGNDLRLKKELTSEGGRIRDDLFVGLASNFTDWLHLGLDVMFHLDTKAELDRSFVTQVYLELYFDVLFDNTSGGTPARRGAHEEARDG
ncbi:MAG: hypothetical protein HYV07_00890 [Deltaproteobacteria bacterium]|nr:hypothetical protein [Deltaproteobacteria bacterium]